jgi:glutaredoxin
MHIEIYSKDQCPYCDMAVRKAQAMIQETSEHTYSVKKLGVDFTREELLEKFPDAKTFPQITVDGVSIGGWTEFQKVQ